MFDVSLLFFGEYNCLPFVSLGLFGWKGKKVRGQKIGKRQKKFQFSLVVFGLKVEKWRDRKLSLYKFIFIPLIDKKVTNLEKKNIYIYIYINSPMNEPKKKKTNRVKSIKKDKKTKEEKKKGQKTKEGNLK